MNAWILTFLIKLRCKVYCKKQLKISFKLTLMQVRGLPCAHNFHVECIDEWLRLNVKCPRCRCSVFPNLDLSALSNLPAEPERSSASVVTTTSYVRGQPSTQSYRLRLQGLLRPVRAEIAGPVGDIDNSLDNVENGFVSIVTHNASPGDHVSSVECVPVTVRLSSAQS